ncbi:hypothetical protein D3C81_2210620 [compost metagenome]
MKNLKIRLKVFIMILIPLVTVIFTAIDSIVEINNTYNTLQMHTMKSFIKLMN